MSYCYQDVRVIVSDRHNTGYTRQVSIVFREGYATTTIYLGILSNDECRTLAKVFESAVDSLTEGLGPEGKGGPGFLG